MNRIMNIIFKSWRAPLEAVRHVSGRRLCLAVMGCILALARPGNLLAAQAARDLLREHRIADTDAERIINYFTHSEKLGLPSDFLRLRLREGLTKGVDQEQILKALEARLQALEQAQQLMARVRHTPPSGRRRHRRPDRDASMATVARALESGLPFETLESLFTPADAKASVMRLHPIVEAGEMMHLAGVPPEAIRHFMHDCRDRGLGRRETLRAADFWIDHHERGMPPETIRRQLWGETRSGDRNQRSEPKHRRQRDREHPSQRMRQGP